jgi:lipopolysaccharide/colanic/teichoic acid biosynthesis glycosyltransferase
MKIFDRNTWNHRHNDGLPVDPGTGLYNRSFFLLRLKEERERSKRTGVPFSLLVADIAGISMALRKQATGPSQIGLRKLVEQFPGQMRIIDIKGWLDEKRIGILLPGTEEVGAFHVKSKICTQLEANLPYVVGLDVEEFLKTYTFRSDSNAGNSSLSDGSDTRGAESGSEEDGLYADILHPDSFSSFGMHAKRMIDIAGSLLGIIIISPLLLIIAVLIKLTSPGPILFRQQRVGFLGRRFILLKFRSMYVEADEHIHKNYVTQLIKGRHDTINLGTVEDPLFKLSDDSRVTTLGRILRKTSLDELPQLFNILRGEMSLVGPRPPIPYEVSEYRLWHCGRFLEIRPGLTGLWQISGRSQMEFDDMVRLDLRYANIWSLWLDLKIILKTLHAVLSTKGAY